MDINYFKKIWFFVIIIGILNAQPIVQNALGGLLNGLLAPAMQRNALQFQVVPQISISPRGFATQLGTQLFNPVNLYAVQFPRVNFATAVPAAVPAAVPQAGNGLPEGSQLYWMITNNDNNLLSSIGRALSSVVAPVATLVGALGNMFSYLNSSFGGGVQVQPYVILKYISDTIQTK